MKKLLPILLFLVGALAGYKISRHFATFQPVSGTYTVKVDTVFKFDTIRLYEPKIVERRVTDTMVVEVTDYVVVHDTAFVSLPREEVEYRDTSYRAVVSGYQPRLDELEIYQRERVVTIQTREILRSRWGLGVQVGAGVNTGGRVQPYIGLGISYNFLSLP